MKSRLTLCQFLQKSELLLSKNDYYAFFKDILQSSASIKDKLKALGHYYRESVIPAGYTIAYGVIDFLFAHVKDYPKVAMSTLSEIAEPSLISYFLPHVHAVIKITQTFIQYFNKEAHFDEELQDITLELFKYCARNTFFQDYFKPVEVVDFLLQATDYGITRKYAFFELYGELLGAQMDIYGVLMEHDKEYGVLASLSPVGRMRIMDLLLTAVEYSVDLSHYSFVLDSLQNSIHGSKLNEKALLLTHKIALLDSNILRKIDPTFVCEISRQSGQLKIKECAREILQMMEEHDIIVGELRNGLEEYALGGINETAVASRQFA